jgi:hypothetical protein
MTFANEIDLAALTDVKLETQNLLLNTTTQKRDIRHRQIQDQTNNNNKKNEEKKIITG